MKDKNSETTDSPSKRKQAAKQARKIKNKRIRQRQVEALKTPAQKRNTRKRY